MSTESSRRDFFDDVIYDRFIFQITKLRSPSALSSYLKQVQDYLKQEFIFTVNIHDWVWG